MYFIDKKFDILINKEDKRKIPFLLIIVLISSLIEVLGLSILIPLSNLVLNKDSEYTFLVKHSLSENSIIGVSRLALEIDKN